MKFILGRKLGMSQIFSEDGTVVPVTVIEAEPNTITQVKTKAKDGYEAVQLEFGKNKREFRIREIPNSKFQILEIKSMYQFFLKGIWSKSAGFQKGKVFRE